MRRVGTFVIACAVLLAACGGDDGASEVSSGGSAQTAAPGQTEPADGSSTETVTGEAPEAEGDDSCRVEVTGDKTASWTTPGGISALNTDYWLPPEQKELFGEGFYFIINCDGDGGSVSFFASNDATADSIPFGPATYTLNPANGALGASSEGPISVMFVLADSETNWGVAEPGVLEITAFDDDHIAGTFDFTATDVLYDLAGVESEGTVRVTGSFDYRNPN